jgi:GT2 family glycosyltransferase
MNLSISIIVCTRNRFDDFKKTIASLMQQSRLPDELIIVDSSDFMQIEEYLNTLKPMVNIQYFHTQPGLTLQRNYGIRKSRGDLLFFFDDDVDLDPNYIREVERVFIKDTRREIGAVGGHILNPLKKQPMSFQVWIGHEVYNFLTFVFGLGRNGNGRFRYSGMPTHPDENKESGYIECLSGCCMAFRKEVFEKIEFDEYLPNYGLMEDVDISKRTLDIGYMIYYERSAALVHNESPKNRLNRYLWAEMTVVNYAYLFHKNWRQNRLRFIFFYWAMIGLVVLHLRKRDALNGVLSGMKKIKWR